jgi:hydrogenase nickel incorporation protein HypA/HybF
MHEAMVAENLLAAISSEAAKQNAKPLKAKISCGVFGAISDDLLRFALDAIAQGTPCEGVKIEIEHKPLQARCRNCGKTFDFDIMKSTCSHCASDQFDLLPDAPLLLEEIEFESE